MKKQPEEMTICELQCLLMPQGELLCLGKTIGWFRDFKEYLRVVKKEDEVLKALKGLLDCNLHENLTGGCQGQIEDAEAAVRKAEEVKK